MNLAVFSRADSLGENFEVEASLVCLILVDLLVALRTLVYHDVKLVEDFFHLCYELGYQFWVFEVGLR